jgi:hypothetical protein
MTRRLHLLLAASLLATAVAPRGGAAATVPLRPLPGGLFAASVEVEGEALWMIVDTGATRSMVRSEVAARLDLKPRARFRWETAAGAADGLCAGPVAARIGATRLLVDCLGWSAAADAAELGPGIAGVLGADALVGRPLLLDPRRALLELDGDVAVLAGTTVPLALVEGRPVLTLGKAGGGAGLRLVLDSAAEELVLFGRAAAAVPARGAVGLATLRGSRQAAVGPAPRLIGLPRPPRRAVLLPDVGDRGEDGLLPLAAVGTVALDWRRGVAVLADRGPAYPPRARRPGAKVWRPQAALPAAR